MTAASREVDAGREGIPPRGYVRTSLIATRDTAMRGGNWDMVTLLTWAIWWMSDEGEEKTGWLSDAVPPRTDDND